MPELPEPAKQAVVLIHGMGETIPMDTIKGFVATVWERDDRITRQGLPNPNKTWSKPDDRTGSLELRRITTRQSIPGGAFANGVRTDFYELYWADLSAGSTWDQFVNWVRYLLFRPLRRVPTAVRSAWAALWVATLVVVAFGSIAFIPGGVWSAHAPSWFDQKLVIALFAVAGASLHQVATRSFGRVVRYTRADPNNIAARAAIRARGLELLRALHRGRAYDRVIVVGHSLGAILAYDLLSYFWAERVHARTIEENTAAFAALCAVEKNGRDLEFDPADPTRRDAFIAAQATLRHAIIDRAADQPDRPWLISDLVTLGSPLTHAEFLLAQSGADLRARQEARELPTCPPYRETLDPNVLAAAVATDALPIELPPEDTRLMSFPDTIGSGRWILHHAAPFALVRWTNLYDTARHIVYGDLIGGPAAPRFGPAVADVDLAVVDRPAQRFTHSRYWAADQSPARAEALHRAINLQDV